MYSEGDRSPFYQNCVKSCLKANCTDGGRSFTPSAAKQLELSSQIFLWNCRDECRYHCMWRTVQGFQERGYQIPKFHGKWPFKRILGVQEPASAFSSLLNLAAHVYMHAEMTRQFPVDRTPIVLFWHFFAAVCMNAWIWSIIFHTRDNPFTEFMDYACALSMVMILFVAAIVRVFHKRRKTVAVILVLSVLYYVEHVRYLYSESVDYDYNMVVNIFFGVAGCGVWALWAGAQVAAGRSYAWRALAFVAGSGAALALELLDFPPHLHAWDAHALWHLATAPLVPLFYRFVIDDLKYTQKAQGSGKNDYKLT
ncbi:unnamed protein product [Parnassius apollo]|uniref:Post-GPI attachment to proteins factor 3 n=1 Tax=Parnassius apollo TaxID=110799 RepID=A0A8S3XAN3_PARAO|nr:unnamed protein product [Parnassius apollo]